MTSQRKRIYNWFIQELNQNTKGVTFGGNFVFKFWPQAQGGVADFEIISTSENTLDFEFTEVVPVVNIQSIEIPYVEQNNRSDFEQEYYIALQIENRYVEETSQLILEFDDTDPKYEALLETVQNIRSSLTFDFDGFKFTVKAREPQVVQTVKYNGKYYTLFSLVLNMSAIDAGFYGNEMEFYIAPLGDALQRLDVIEADVVIGKQTATFNEIRFEATDQETKVNSRHWQAQITINYRGTSVDNLIFDELMASTGTTIVKPYTFRMRQNETNYDKVVYITSVNGNYRNNSVETLTFQLERV